MHIVMKWVIFLVAVGLVFCFSKYGFGPYTALHKTPTLDGKPLYKPSEVPVRLAALDKENFLPKYFEQESTIDLIFPLVYGMMFVTAIVFLTPGARTPRWLAAIPLITVLADYAENTTVILLLKRYPKHLGGLPWIASIASGTKGVTLLASAVTVVVLAIVWLIRQSGAHAPAV